MLVEGLTKKAFCDKVVILKRWPAQLAVFRRFVNGCAKILSGVKSMSMISDAKELGKQCGFSHVGDLDAAQIKLRQAVRDICAMNDCGAYGTRWSCPPGCGTLEECESRIRQFKKGVLLQTTVKINGYYDTEGLAECGRRYWESIDKFVKSARKISGKVLVLSGGTCNRCKQCTYPDEPCRFPDEMTSSMESYGMLVSEVCENNGLQYNYGQDTMTYTACALFE
jgi:predicted metal-binding protein